MLTLHRRVLGSIPQQQRRSFTAIPVQPVAFFFHFPFFVGKCLHKTNHAIFIRGFAPGI
jgi:hypothetical protein